MKKIFVKCVGKHERLTLGKKYMAYSHENPLRPLTENEWLNMTQEDLLVVIADNDVKISFAKWRFVRADKEIESAMFESTLGQIDELEKEFEMNVRELKEQKPALFCSDSNAIKVDDVIKPNHYKSGDMDVIAFCQYHDLPFDIGNIVKYVVRAGKKANNSELQDLNKAMEYLKRRIAFVEKQEKR